MLRILYQIHRIYFKTLGLTLKEGNFNINKVVQDFVDHFNTSVGKWSNGGTNGKAMLKKHSMFFEISIDFTNQQAKFFNPKELTINDDSYERFISKDNLQSPVLTRRDLYNEIEKASIAKPTWKQYEKDTFQVLFEIHRVFFKSQNKFLEFEKFIENRAVGVFVQTFINTLRKMYPTLSRSGPKWAFKQHKVFFNTKIDFSLQNFFEENSDEPLKENEEIQKICQISSIETIDQNQSSEELKSIEENSTKRRRTRKQINYSLLNESGVVEEHQTEEIVLQPMEEETPTETVKTFVLTSIEKNPTLAMQLKSFIENYSEFERDAMLQQPLIDPLQTTDNIKEELSNSFEIESHDIELMK